MANALTIQVGSITAYAFPSTYGEQLTVQNSGTVTVFLGDSTGLTVSSGFPLSAGSTIVWDKGRPLYAIAAVPSGGQITIMTNGGNLNDVSALANAILDAGLADDIAQAISVKGVPIIDDPGNLFYLPTTTNIDTAPISWVIDVSRYQSISWLITGVTGTTGKTPTFPSLLAGISYYSDTGNVLQQVGGQMMFRSAANTGNQIMIRTPAVGAQAGFAIQMLGGSKAGTGGGIQTIAMGSYRQIDPRANVESLGYTLIDAQNSGYISGLDNSFPFGLTSFWLPSSNSYSTETVIYPTSRSGKMQFTLTGSLKTANFSAVPHITIQDASNPTVRYKTLSWATNTTITLAENFVLDLPSRPIAIAMKDFTPTSGNEPVISLLYDPI